MHTATKRLRTGVCIYAYAFRGGRLVAKGLGEDLVQARAALERELGKPEALALLAEALRPIPVSTSYVGGLVTAYLASPEFDRLADSTRRDYRRVLDEFRAEFGAYPSTFGGKAEDDLIEWRDEKRNTPRAADYRMSVVGALFAWGRAKRLTKAEPTKNIPALHRSDRSDAIWTAAELQRLFAVCSPSVRQAVELASLTGLRMSDLLSLTWGQVTDHAITLQTSKSRKRRTALIPLFPATQALLEEVGRRDIGTVLTNTRGKPWTRDGFKTSFMKARDAAGLSLRFHDLRGTAATRLALMGAEDEDIALILGWSKESVRALLTKYVSADAVALDMLRRITERTGRYKPPTNRVEAEPKAPAK